MIATSGAPWRSRSVNARPRAPERRASRRTTASRCCGSSASSRRRRRDVGEQQTGARVAGERQAGADRGRAHARHRPQALGQPLDERRTLLRRIPRRPAATGGRPSGRSARSRAHRHLPFEAAHHQAGRREQRHRQRDLGGDERPAASTAGGSIRGRGRRSAPLPSSCWTDRGGARRAQGRSRRARRPTAVTTSVNASARRSTAGCTWRGSAPSGMSAITAPSVQAATIAPNSPAASDSRNDSAISARSTCRGARRAPAAPRGRGAAPPRAQAEGSRRWRTRRSGTAAPPRRAPPRAAGAAEQRLVNGSHVHAALPVVRILTLEDGGDATQILLGARQRHPVLEPAQRAEPARAAIAVPRRARSSATPSSTAPTGRCRTTGRRTRRASRRRCEGRSLR